MIGITSTTHQDADVIDAGVSPDQVAALTRVHAREVRSLRDQLMRLEVRSAGERVQSLLATLADETPDDWVELPFGREEMGALIGLDRATVSRTLHRLARAGTITLSGRHFRIRPERPTG